MIFLPSSSMLPLNEKHAIDIKINKIFKISITYFIQSTERKKKSYINFWNEYYKKNALIFQLIVILII